MSSISGFIKRYGILGLKLEFANAEEHRAMKILKDFLNYQIQHNPSLQDSSNTEWNDSDKDIFAKGITDMLPDLIKIAGERAVADLTWRIENTVDFICEVKIMKCLLRLYHEYPGRDIECVKRDIEILKILQPSLASELDYLVVNVKADYLHRFVVNYAVGEKVKNVELLIDIEYDDDEKKVVNVPVYYPKTLLSGLYIMFYMDIVGGKIIRQWLYAVIISEFPLKIPEKFTAIQKIAVPLQHQGDIEQIWIHICLNMKRLAKECMPGQMQKEKQRSAILNLKTGIRWLKVKWK